jgi:ribonuclease HII
MGLSEKVAAAIEAADFVVGSDECGYGAWAGPLVVCAAVLPKAWPYVHLVRDSKQVRTEEQREAIARQILPHLTYEILSVPPEDIDRIGVSKVLPWAHGKVLDLVIAKHEASGARGQRIVIVDGSLSILYGEGQKAISVVKGDSLVTAVSAASILGKVARDTTMIALAAKFPGYGFESHKGYGGGDDHAHTLALEKLGPCEIHRKSYSPVRNRMQGPSTSLFDLAMSGELDD